MVFLRKKMRPLNYSLTNYTLLVDSPIVLIIINLLAYTGDDYKGGKTSREYLKFSNEDCQKYIKELKDI